MPDHDDVLVCASYTHARRHPMVLGRIAGWTPPWQLTVTQIGVLLAAFAVVTWTWPWWGPALPDTVALAVAVGAPAGAAWAVRRVRVEGRSLPRAGLGWLALWCVPATGTSGGRPVRDGRRGEPTDRYWVGADPES